MRQLLALDGVQWLAQGAVKDRRPKLGPRATAEVWAANGDRCSFCGKSRTFCKSVGIGLTVQHVQPVVFGGGDDGPLIPFCARCQQSSVAALAETQLLEPHILGVTP